MGHPTMQENDTAKLTPTDVMTCLKQVRFHREFIMLCRT